MASYFIDSSALAKCYLQELGSGWMQHLTDPAMQHEINVLRLSEVEVASGLARRRRNGLLAAADEQLLKTQLRAHFATRFQVIDVTGGVVGIATMLLESHDLRAYDVIQLAACHTLNWMRDAAGLPRLVFVSADGAFNRIAVAIGEAVEDPRNHPQLGNAGIS